MPMTRAEKLAYQRGYNRGLARVSDRVARVIRIAQGYRRRLRNDATTQQRCDGCARWVRGGPNCLWGICDGSTDYGLEPRIWANGHSGNGPSTVITSPDFGCVLWIPR